MYFSFFNALLMFQKYINRAIAERFIIFIIVYLDNILIYAKNLSYLYIKAIH